MGWFDDVLGGVVDIATATAETIKEGSMIMVDGVKVTVTTGWKVAKAIPKTAYNTAIGTYMLISGKTPATPDAQNNSYLHTEVPITLTPEEEELRKAKLSADIQQSINETKNTYIDSKNNERYSTMTSNKKKYTDIAISEEIKINDDINEELAVNNATIASGRLNIENIMGDINREVSNTSYDNFELDFGF